ncbi:MAG: SDR family NAD(P)-dependent oxidoreductase, partial [Arenimonas sp.]
CPGFTYTEFHDVNGMRSSISKLPKFLWLSSERVAKLGVDAVESGKTKVITGRTNNVIAFLCKYLPDWLARSLVASKSKQFRNMD